MLSKIVEMIRKAEPYLSLTHALANLTSGRNVAVRGTPGSLRAILLGALAEELSQQLLVIVASDELHELVEDTCLVAGASHVTVFSDANESSQRAASENLQTLQALANTSARIILSTPSALTSRVPTPEAVRKQTLVLEEKRTYDYSSLLSQLVEFGFVRKQYVQSPGEYSVRGGILDVFPFAGDSPLRIEFDGNIVASIREFDPLSQRSIRELHSALIMPDLLSAESDRTASLLDYLAPHALIVLDERVMDPELRTSTAEETQQKLRWGDLLEQGSAFPQLHLLHTHAATAPCFDFSAVPEPAINSSIAVLRSHLTDLQSQHYHIVITADTTEELQRLKQLLTELEPLAEEQERHAQLAPHVLDVARLEFSLDALHRGFIFPHGRLAVFTEHHIFNRLKRRGRLPKARLKGLTRKDLLELRKGDYVVHADFGIGRFDGLKKISVRDIEQEVLALQYDEKDTLYVNLNYLHKIQKYSSKDGHIPKLTRLGSGEWDRLKARAKKRLQDIARDLIILYAKRKALPGFAFAKDTLWQRELEASFVYEDTPDQSKATEDVKRDMESPYPMDRLICGDVGFGKTEVAVRAAFKAVMSGKQVALLVPTTILAMQHYATFTDRLSRYATHIEVISRFKTRAEQKTILQRLSAGTVDIIIGTHRLLSKDVHFNDLGLLIIDEEHRFGVAAKEKLRQLKATVDTLTLTATPIPRTLHFSLLGARDLSIIATPPRNRLPVITEIVNYDERLIREAILREIQRGGQVFFVHDRVQTMDDVVSRLHVLLPHVRIGKAHGQMHAHELEKIMLAFLERKFDVLVATKIIESGIDMPNVNTIIINRADRFGMAELYQLRGRVGRSNTQAYAYLLVPPISSLPRETVRRLQALEEFTELGSGFNLAMRDLEIRGAGNLLGGEQSGYIDAMGFEMYTRILEEAVAELKEKEFGELFGAQHPRREEQAVIEADADVHIPDWYIEDSDERLAIYRRLYSLTDISEVDDIAAELKDRFGAPPPPVERLLSLVRIRRKATLLGFRKVSLTEKAITIEFPPSSESWFYEAETFNVLMTHIAQKKTTFLRQDGSTLLLVAPLNQAQDAFESAHALLDDLSAVVAPYAHASASEEPQPA